VSDCVMRRRRRGGEVRGHSESILPSADRRSAAGRPLLSLSSRLCCRREMLRVGERRACVCVIQRLNRPVLRVLELFADTVGDRSELSF